MKREIAITAIVGAAILVSACAAQADRRQPAGSPPSISSDEALLAARRAWAKPDPAQLEAAARQVARDHPLADYPPFWRLSLKLRGPLNAAQAAELDGEVAGMLSRQEGSVIGEMLRREWLLNLGRRGEWQTFEAQLARYSRRDDVQINCLAWSSPQLRNPPSRAELEQVLMAPRDLPDTCNLLLEQLVRQGRLGPDAARRRLLRALEWGYPATIKPAADLMGIEPAALQAALAKPAPESAFSGRREVALIALTLLARNDPDAAARRLEAGVASLRDEDKLFLWSQIAAGGMRRLAPDSLRWTQRAVQAPVSDDTLNWMTRAALRAQNWQLVGALIDRMSEEGRRDPAWVYWRARALRAEGRLADSDWLLRSIADGFHFYGQLAAEDLGRLTTLPAQIGRAHV